MNKNFILILAILPFLFSGCNTKPVANEKPILMVTIEPMRYVTEELVGDHFQVVTMVPRGSNPETYEATPRQMIDISRAEAYLRVGPIPFEVNWIERLQKNAPQMKVFNCWDGVELLHTENSCGHDHGGRDPHVWSSVKNMAIIAKNITQALIELDSSNTEFYQSQLSLFLEKLEQLDQTIETAVNKSTVRTFVIYHPALGYLAHDYGLTQLAIEENGKSPTPMRLKNLIEQCRSEKIKTVLVQQEFSTDNATTIANEIEARIVTVNPLAYNWDEEMLNIIEQILYE